MIVTEQQQKKLIESYKKQGKSYKECLAFADGVISALEMIDKLLKKDK